MTYPSTSQCSDDNEQPLVIVRGKSFYLPFVHQVAIDDELYPVDISGYKVQMQIRVTPASTGTPLLDIDSDTPNEIVVDGPQGKFEINISKTVTATIPAGVYSYAVDLTSPTGRKEEIIYGTVTVKEGIIK